MRYLKCTSRFCLCYENEKLELSGYSYANYVGDIDSKKSTSCYIMTFAKGAVSWQSRLQQCATLSTIEAKYIDITKGGKELLCMQMFLQKLSLKQEKFVLYCDSMSIFYLSKSSGIAFKIEV